MKSFIRNNLMIVASIALPLLVILFFALASFVPLMFSTPPNYDLLFSLHDRAAPKISSYRYNFVIRDGQLKAELFEVAQPHYQGYQRLFIYEHETGDVREIGFEIPLSVDDFTEGMIIPVAAMAGNTISANIRAPDGYEFRGQSYNGGLMTELFGGRRNRSDVSIANGGAVIRVRLPTSDYWYNNARFVGWIVEEEHLNGQ